MAEEDDGLPGLELANKLKAGRKLKGLTQDGLAAAAGVSRQLINQYESGKSVNPRPKELGAAWRAAGLDFQELLVVRGYATREELDLPPEAPPVPKVISRILSLLRDPKITDEFKNLLLSGVEGALQQWFDFLRFKTPREASAAERGANPDHSRDGGQPAQT